MDSPDRLPGDQRAVLQLVLGQGRTYGEIAAMLSIAPEQVRDRAHAALAALGPPTAVADEQRGRIADYLLGQLPEPEAADVAGALERSAAQRAWARVVASELRPIAARPLPEIAEAAERPRRDEAPAPEPAPGPSEPVAASEPTGSPSPDGPRSSRTGGIVLLSLLAAAVIAAIVIFVIVKPGQGSHHSHAAGDGARASTRQTTSSTSNRTSSSSTSSTQSASIVGQINLAPPSGGTKVTGTALVLAQGSLKGLGIEAVHVPPNTSQPRTAYAVWLYNSAGDAKRLGFVNPPVTKNGKLAASAQLPADATHYRLLIITLETETGANHRHVGSTPGPVVLEGKLSAVPKSRL